ncbi:baseplate J-like family protein [Anoxybacillus sp. B7M1]|uniref:baseplate J/gp47 family protein n=1 Tax=unclassified Anoxybacillus TaxID=2639704 RepID=UPI0005CCE46B|nr:MULTISPECIES: baseplate J/gp47 family protein [unclassified Anoxybacillus]ANB58077.1 baseplate J-like family protein [Anoxybacillus sp. B2M1]ANB65582.1 baseplate J-like family protein [Anoxybacillus sp. B7M1]
MFEDRTFETILEEMLDDIPDDFDKQERSPIYIALAPAAKKLADAYVQLDRVLNLVFASTSEGEYLERRTSEIGVFKKRAIKAIREGIFNIPVDVGSRFFVDGVYYVVTEAGTNAKLQCEEAGTIGNKPPEGSVLLPLDNIDGLETAILGKIIAPGEEEEEDQYLYARYQEKASKPATGGNIYHYLQWAKEVPGIRAAKVFPRWQGKGTVRVVVVGSDGRAPSQEKVTEVFNRISNEMPIDVDLTVDTAVEVPINITADLILQPGVDIETIEFGYKTAIEKLFSDSALTTNTVRYSQLSSMILEQDGVIDYQNFLINDKTSNLILGDDEIAVVGTVIFNVI